MGSGYDFVPLPPTVNREARADGVFDRRVPGALWVTMEIELVAVERIHIGSGFRALRGQRAVRAAARSGDRLMIPGSSMKGLLRARYEAITKSCAPHQAPRGKLLDSQLPSTSYSDYTVKFSSSVQQQEVFKACELRRSCSACSLFGRMSQRGRISVLDFVAPAEATALEVEIPKRYSPRPHHLGRFSHDPQRSILTVDALHGRKFHVGNAEPAVAGELAEVMKRGTRLSGKVTCMNISLAELGGLLSALGAHPISSFKIGSAKAHRFGRLELAKNVEIQVERPRDFDGTDFLAKVRSAFKTSRDYWRQGELALSAMHAGGEP